MPPRRTRRGPVWWLRLVVVIGVWALAAAAWWYWHPPDPRAEVRAHARALATFEREPAPDLGRGFERWRMIAEGDTVLGMWRAAVTEVAGDDEAHAYEPNAGPSGARVEHRGPGPRAGNQAAAEWAVVILGGIGTDDRAALLVPDSLPVAVLAVSWPWTGSRRMSRLQFLASLPALRTALLRTPGAIARGVEAVRRAAPGTRIALLGASLGVPPMVAAIPLARPDAVVLVDGAADLRRLLASETAHALGDGAGSGWVAAPAAALAARLLSSLEPVRYRDAAREMPTLLIDAAHDERYPPACVRSLHATFRHAALATHPGGHLRPENREQMSAIVRASWRWLEKTSE